MNTKIEAMFGRKLITNRTRAGPQGSSTQRPIEIIRFHFIRPFTEIGVEFTLTYFRKIRLESHVNKKSNHEKGVIELLLTFTRSAGKLKIVDSHVATIL